MIEKKEQAPPPPAPELSTPSLQQLGWTFRERHIDNDPEKPILGIRLTNCAKIFENAQTIQIFDTNTVTLQFGFLQEQSVSLTGEDGQLFIDWLKATHPQLAAPMLAAVPAGDPTPGASNTGLNMSKAHLVEYLADAFPERFGRGAQATKPGTDFYTEVLALLRDPDRDSARRVALVLAAENMAHDMYADCNATLRRAARAQAPEMVAEFEMDAYGRAIAAETARLYAKAIRARIPHEHRPPAAEFPEAIEPESIPIVRNIRAANSARVDELTGKKPPAMAIVAPTADNLASTPHQIRVGALVAVIDPSHPKFRQMGQIKTIDEEPGMVGVLVSGATAVDLFSATQLMSIA